jgi:hypothetical protein
MFKGWNCLEGLKGMACKAWVQGDAAKKFKILNGHNIVDPGIGIGIGIGIGTGIGIGIGNGNGNGIGIGIGIASQKIKASPFILDHNFELKRRLLFMKSFLNS